MAEIILTVFFLPLLVSILTSLFEYWINNRRK